MPSALAYCNTHSPLSRALLCCMVCCLHPQEVGDKTQLVTRLTEQISEAEAAHQAAKAARNEAQDKRKEAWKLETELKDKVNKASADFDRAFSVSSGSACFVTLGCMQHSRLGCSLNFSVFVLQALTSLLCPKPQLGYASALSWDHC